MSALKKTALHTIGHSTRTLESFIELLRGYHIALLVDVRTVPSSRRVPHFNKTRLQSALSEEHVRYRHLPALGGLRKPDRNSPNQGWKNASFRGYADYMQTESFENGMNLLLSDVDQENAAVMCAEAVPWRCHRSLISDALLVQGHPVIHILSPSQVLEHSLTSFARVVGTRIVYPPVDHGGPDERLF